ncbi:MAG: 3'(2'),5'-bisphosphate nucleotidase CysQ [Calditrichia bacterium]
MNDMIDILIDIAREAGRRILAIYESGNFGIEIKTDQSPLTLADKASNEYIVEQLKAYFPQIPVLSEETKMVPFDTRKSWDRFWLVDPLDGTKEFIKRNGEFTVNIALIENNLPKLGVIYSPVPDILYYNLYDGPAYKADSSGPAKPIRVKNGDSGRLIAVQSRSHSSEKEQDLYRKLDIHSSTSIGSSLKLCLIAEGRADIYYRSGPTMEWDTAAGHAILTAAGGAIYNNSLSYNKPELLNGEFIATVDEKILEGVL